LTARSSRGADIETLSFVRREKSPLEHKSREGYLFISVKGAVPSEKIGYRPKNRTIGGKRGGPKILD